MANTASSAGTATETESPRHTPEQREREKEPDIERECWWVGWRKGEKESEWDRHCWLEGRKDRRGVSQSKLGERRKELVRWIDR